MCKECFRCIEALNQRSKDIEDSKREIVEHYEKTKESNKACFGANGARFKRLAKQSLGMSEKRGRSIVFTLQLTRNGEMTLAVYRCSTMQLIEIHNFRIMVKNGKMTVALHHCNLMKKICRRNFQNMVVQANFLRV